MPTANAIMMSISLALEIWLLVLLVRRDVRRHFPVFFSYGLALGPVTLARLFTTTDYQTYFLVFWWSDAMLLLLGLAALHEVFRWVYRSFYEFWWFRLGYYGAITAVLLIAIRNAVANPPVQAHPVVSLVLDVGIGINLLQAGIATLYYAIMRPLSIEFRRYPYGVVLGFLISSAGPLLGYLAISVFGTKVQGFARYASPVSYFLGLAIWLSAFIVPEIEEKEWIPPMSAERMLHEVRGYLRAMGFKGKGNEH